MASQSKNFFGLNFQLGLISHRASTVLLLLEDELNHLKTHIIMPFLLLL